MKALLFAALLAVGCARPPVPPEPEITVVDGSNWCPGACRKLADLGCPEAETTTGGVTCERVCLDSQPYIKAECVAKAGAKAELLACDVRCRR